MKSSKPPTTPDNGTAAAAPAHTPAIAHVDTIWIGKVSCVCHPINNLDAIALASRLADSYNACAGMHDPAAEIAKLRAKLKELANGLSVSGRKHYGLNDDGTLAGKDAR